MNFNRQVWVSNDGDMDKGLEIWSEKPEWINYNPDITPCFQCKDKKMSDLYLATHTGKNKMGLSKGQYCKAVMSVKLKRMVKLVPVPEEKQDA